MDIILKLGNITKKITFVEKLEEYTNWSYWKFDWFK